MRLDKLTASHKYNIQCYMDQFDLDAENLIDHLILGDIGLKGFDLSLLDVSESIDHQDLELVTYEIMLGMKTVKDLNELYKETLKKYLV